MASLSASHALRVWIQLLVPLPPAQDPRTRPSRNFGDSARCNKKGAPEGAFNEKGRGGSRSRSPPPVAEASGLRAAGLSPHGLALCVSDLRVCGNPLRPATGMQAPPGEDSATSGEIAGRAAAPCLGALSG